VDGWMGNMAITLNLYVGCSLLVIIKPTNSIRKINQSPIAYMVTVRNLNI